MNRIYDISAKVTASMPIYPNDLSIKITSWASIAKNDPANVTTLNFSAHTGTHVDAPAHFIEGAMKVDELPLDILIGRALVIEIPDDVRAVDAELLSSQNLYGATRVLFKTRNSSFWDEAEDFREDYTYLTTAAARLLVELGVRLVGIDYLSIEEFASTTYATHKMLLSREVIIIEGLNLREVPAGEYELICLPLKIAEGLGDGAPARAILRDC